MSICSQRPIALCSTCKMKYCTNRVFVGCIDQAYFFLCFICASYLQQILSEITTLYSHTAKISPKNAGYRSLNLIIRAPINELCDSVTARSTAPSHVKLPYFSFLPLSLLPFVYLLLLIASLSLMLGIIHTVFQVPSCTTTFLFLLLFSLWKRKKHDHSAGLLDKR